MGEVQKQDTSKDTKVCRLVVQQCRKASLNFDTDDPEVGIGPGMVIFTCFLQGAEERHLDSIVKAIVNAKLCEDSEEKGNTSSSKRDSVLSYKQNILVIPQATLGGKLKGKAVQYHGLVEKTFGENLFQQFVDKLRQSLTSTGQNHGQVSSGVYGARQILSMETNGPFTHVFEF